MEVFAREKRTSIWRVLKSGRFGDERELQKMITNTPDPFLLHIRNIRGFRNKNAVFVTKMECGLPGSGSSDILGVDSDGEIYLIECKLSTNREIRRQVVGQVIEYAAYLNNVDYRTFGEMVSPEEDLAGCIGRKCAEAVELIEFDPRVFEDIINKKLNSGDFNLVIAVDEINEELETIIRFLNNRTDFVIIAVEASHIKDDSLGLELLFPTVYGEKEVPQESGDVSKEMGEIGTALFREGLLGDEGHPTRRMFYGCLACHPAALLVGWVSTGDEYVVFSLSPDEGLIEIIGAENPPKPSDLGIDFPKEVEIKSWKLKPREWWIRSSFGFKDPGLYINEITGFIKKTDLFLRKALSEKR